MVHFTSFWVNYNIWLTWIKAILGWFLLLTMIPVRSQWGRYNLPRSFYYVWFFIAWLPEDIYIYIPQNNSPTSCSACRLFINVYTLRRAWSQLVNHYIIQKNILLIKNSYYPFCCTCLYIQIHFSAGEIVPSVKYCRTFQNPTGDHHPPVFPMKKSNSINLP